MDETPKYRVFICYAHEDVKPLERIVDHLHRLGAIPRYSGTLQAGTPFPNQIKERISRAHLFVPILTEISGQRPWVDQEIGFALGANVPILPLSLARSPVGLTRELQALPLQPDLSDLEEKLTYDVLESAVTLGGATTNASYEVAPLHEDRTQMLVSAAEWLLQNREHVPVRQWGAFSSFSLPDKEYLDPIWSDMDGDGVPRCWGLRRDLQRERRLLEQHARASGCKLIVDADPPYGSRGDAAKRVRLEILVEFLQSMQNVPEDRVQVAVVPAEESIRPGNLLLLGDWFLAESVTPRPGTGYLQTLGTWHAPSVLARVQEFDRLFADLASKTVPEGESSREHAIRYLTSVFEKLPRPQQADTAGTGRPR